MHQSVRDIWVPFNEPLEARVNFMYLDVKGLVTTGLGNLIDASKTPNSPPTDAERADSWVIARRLNWLTADGSVASDQEIDDEWDRTKARLDEANRGGLHFGQYATIFLPDDEIDRLVFSKLDEMEGVLRGREPFRGFEDMPADAQLGLLSMSWGMGPMFRFPKFQGFVAAGQWNDAATECRFNPDRGTIRTRNDRNQQLFRNAGTVIDAGLDPSNLLWSGE